MGAYENPVVPVDTQSGQYYRELQNTIATSFAGVAQGYSDRAEKTRTEYNKRKAEIENNLKEAQKFGFDLYTELAKNSENNTTVDWNKTYEPLIQKAVKYRSDLLNGFSKDPQKDLKELSNIKSSIDSVVTSIADLSAAGKTLQDADFIGVGTANGLSANNIPSRIAAVRILTNPQMEGTKELVFENDNPLNGVWIVKDKNGNLVDKIGISQLKNLSNPNGTGLLQIVKDPVKQYDQNIIPLSKNIFGGEEVKNKDGGMSFVPNGTINDALLTGPVLYKDAPGTKKMVNGKLVASEKIEYRAVNLEEIKKDPTLNNNLNAAANGNLTNPIDAFNMYSEVFKDVIPIDKNLTKDDLLTDEGKKEYTRAFKEYFYKTQIPPTQDLRKVPTETATTEFSVEDKSKGKVSGGTDKESKDGLSPAERKERNQIYQRNKEAVAKLKEVNLSKPLVSPANPDERMIFDRSIPSISKGKRSMGAWVKQIKNKKTGKWKRDLSLPAIRSRNEAAKTFLPGLNLNAPTIEDYFATYDVNAKPPLE